MTTTSKPSTNGLPAMSPMEGPNAVSTNWLEPTVPPSLSILMWCCQAPDVSRAAPLGGSGLQLAKG